MAKPQVMLENDEGEAPFMLFDLPRDVRDMIYECALLSKAKLIIAPDTYCDVEEIDHIVNASACPTKSLLFVSKQFAKEYLQAAKKKTTISCRPPGAGYFERVPKFLVFVTKFEFALAFEYLFQLTDYCESIHIGLRR